MKSVKYFLICLISITIINCGGNDSKRAKTPAGPTGPTVTCTNPSLCPTVVPGEQGQTRVYHSSNIIIDNHDLYDDILRAVYGTCDRPQYVLGSNFWETLLLSGIFSAGTRCSKWNDRAELVVTLNGHQEATFQYDLKSSYLGGSFRKNIIYQTTPLVPARGDTELYADINTNFYPYNNQRGISMSLAGDVYSNEFTVYLDYFGDDVAHFKVRRVR